MNTSEWEQSIDLRVDSSSDDRAVESVIQYPSVELAAAGRIREAEAVINKVMEVAESNRTIERILERRHEVKDFAAKDARAQESKTYSNDAVDTQERQYSASMISKTPATDHAFGAVIYRRLMSTNSLYGYAIRYGFLSALIALLIAVITVSLFT